MSANKTGSDSKLGNIVGAVVATAIVGMVLIAIVGIFYRFVFVPLFL